MSFVRPLRKTVLLPDWFWVTFIMVAIGGEILFDSIWFVAALVLALVAQGVYVFAIARCPVCSGHLAFHRSDTYISPTKYRLQLECKKCHAIWDTGRIRDDGYTNG
jgi:hypothetical protein